MTSEQLVRTILENIQFDKAGIATINQKEFSKVLSKVVDVPQIPVAFDFKQLAEAIEKLNPNTSNQTEQLVSAISQLKPEAIRTPIKNLTYDELDTIQLRMFQCLNSYGQEVGKSMYVDTESIKSKPIQLKTTV